MQERYRAGELAIYSWVMEPLENNLYVVVSGPGGPACMIDAPSASDELARIVEELGVEEALITHGHFDHIGGVEQLRRLGVRVLVGEGDQAAIDKVDGVLRDGDIRSIGSVRLRVLATPGHTPGSVCLLVEGHPILFTGDTLFPGGPGATQFPGGDFAAIIESVRGLLALPGEVRVLPGHGAETTLATEAPHLEEWIARGW